MSQDPRQKRLPRARVEQIDVKELDQERIAEAVLQVGFPHNFSGYASATEDKLPLLVFPLSNHAASQKLKNDDFSFELFPAGMGFGSGLIAVGIIAHMSFSYILSKLRDPAFPFFVVAKFICVFCHKQTAKCAFIVNFDHTEFKKYWYEAADWKPVFFDDKAYYWESIETLYEVNKEAFELGGGLSPADFLSVSWVKSYRRAALNCSTALKKIIPLGKQDIDDRLPETLKFLLNFSRDHSDIRYALTFLEKEIIPERKLRVPAFIDFGAFFYNEEYPELYHTFFGNLMRCHLLSPDLTNCGRALPWLDIDAMTIKTLPLVPEEFIGKASQSAYWENIPSEIFRNNWGKLISGTDVPLSPEKFANGFKNIVIKESKEGTNDAANLLLQEAVTNKKWSIPPHAPVELTIGPFSHFELTEQGNSVVAVGRTSSGEFTVFHVWPKQGAILIPTSFLERLEKRDLVEACLKLLLSAIIRDFWVVEQRETVFHTTEVKRLPWRKESPSDDPAIVYIPRVRYSSPSVRQCSEGLEHTLRRAHFVTGHLRKADTPSERQILIAQRYGIDVAQGYTFVKPHERGRHKREVIYRSRSALRMLYQERILQGEGKSRWFEFERDVYDLMRSIGFEVEHCAASHRGDRGVDVFATKGTDLEEINWIIQCKCFGPKRKVGPNIVRDLIGAIGQFKKGTRGMIVTTSSFTEEATKLALSEGIRLIDGIEFSKMIETAKGSQGTP